MFYFELFLIITAERPVVKGGRAENGTKRSLTRGGGLGIIPFKQKARMGTRRGPSPAQRAGGWCEPVWGVAWILAPEPSA